MGEPSVAALLLRSASRDFAAVHALAGVPSIHDSIVGFHAHQAVEKSIRAALQGKRVPFRRTHDIAELLDLLADRRLPLPPCGDKLDELDPYAVEARYGPIEVAGLDRSTIGTMADAVLEWASALASPQEAE